MSRSLSQRLTWFVFGLGVAASAGVYLRFGLASAVSCGLGVAVALANWFLLRTIVARVIAGNVKQQAKFGLLLIGKMLLLLGLIFVVLRSGFVQPIAFTVGISSLAIGTLLGSFVHVLTAKAVESER